MADLRRRRGPIKKPRPFHIWWLGILLFAPPVLVWGAMAPPFVLIGIPELCFDSVRHIYLPMIAAMVGLSVPIACLLFLRQVSPKRLVAVFATYLVAMLLWGFFDIRNQNYQMSGYNYPSIPMVDGHKHYFHVYFTWWFMPYKTIEKGLELESDSEPGT